MLFVLFVVFVVFVVWGGACLILFQILGDCQIRVLSHLSSIRCVILDASITT